MLSKNLTKLVENSTNLFDNLLYDYYLRSVVGLNFVKVFFIRGVDQVGLEVKPSQRLMIVLFTLFCECLLLV